MEVEAEMDFSSFNSCQALSPAYVDATQPGGIYYFGWALACSPCNFIGTESFDFQYRLQGSSSWNTLTKTYYGGPYFLPLSSGIYEWRHRNKKISSVSCDGPWSEVQTFTVN